MLAEALCIVKYAGKQPYLHLHVWIAHDYRSAIREMAEWKLKMEKQENCVITVKSFKFTEWIDGAEN